MTRSQDMAETHRQRPSPQTNPEQMLLALEKYGQELAAIPDEPPQILEKAIRLTEMVSGSAPVAIYLLEQDSAHYTAQYSSGFADGKRPHRAVADQSALVRLLSGQNHPIYMAADPEPSPQDTVPPEARQQVQGLGVVLLVPLRIQQKLEGWLALGARPSGERYGAQDVAFLSALMAQTAIGLENARLREKAREVDREKLDFIDFVAHELKQPMTAMHGYAKMLTMGIGGEMNDTQKQFVAVINSNVDRMAKLVNDLLEISRLEAGRIKLNLAPVRLQDVVDETVAASRSQIQTRNHTLEVQVPDNLPPVWGDRERLGQILGHLVSNACRYTPDGGAIRITVDRWPQAETPSDQVRVSVSDTGIGLSPEDLAGLQQKFFRADHELVHAQPGTGLGLSITRGLVALHGGQFIIESEAALGSTFSFSVPVFDGSEA